MIRVRYRDFRSGSSGVTWLYGTAERGARGVTVYLLPGLASWERRAVIRRLRQEASRGCGPALPVAELVIALAVDRVRMAVKLAVSLVRLHPAVTLLPSAVMVAAMTLFVLASAGGGQRETVHGPGPAPLINFGDEFRSTGDALSGEGGKARVGATVAALNPRGVVLRSARVTSAGTHAGPTRRRMPRASATVCCQSPIQVPVSSPAAGWRHTQTSDRARGT